MKFPAAAPLDAVKFCEFVTASPSPFHAVANLSQRLKKAGFERVSEREPTQKLSPGGKYFYTRNQSALVAFTLPHGPANAASLVAGHCDSPCLKVRPVSKRQKAGYLQVGTELYGGGLWHTWFDRNLSIAGRVILSTPGARTEFTSKLVKIDRPILHIPTLAIHLDRGVNEQLKFNKETEFLPVLGLVNEQLNSGGSAVPSRTGTPAPGKKEDGKSDGASMEDKHHPLLLAAIADELGCAVADIHDFELCLYDTQPSTVGGLNNEFIFSPRLDNLTTSWCAIEGLCQAVEAEAASGQPSKETNVRCALIYDNEEVGSVSNHGAESNILPSFIEMLAGLPNAERGYYQILANSYLISADMGHALHPNYEGRYETNNAPKMNQGIVIKTNANQRYTSNAQTTFLLRQIAKRAGVPVQEFEIRNDSTCGSTVGPHLSTHVRTVDIGLASLSMHSIQETSGSGDIKYYTQLFKTFYEEYSKVEKVLTVDEA
ncbi:aspartyl aminopeptidase [Cutaneotrichosporon oleaginosum]|uniref:aspartyl aminopeptidase n=1 Tax=Cutaneotrichosporon oleaginosum TaxID=879819 RepID=A0A0J0XPQ3_9TREE|nr:aspartyl aminopeptidase [Cutaneotrichosporon oleaginosum]KLT43095.1 aspartyl aminopeptidase [Cutaneotrichosporon oleaginosum]TXT10023.1 hypothetical protein COLE_03957 [Cutaneotrichosporon oleaginosum]